MEIDISGVEDNYVDTVGRYEGAIKEYNSQSITRRYSTRYIKL